MSLFLGAVVDPVGMAVPVPTPPLDAFRFCFFLPIVEFTRSADKPVSQNQTATPPKLARIVYQLVRSGMASVKQTEAASAEQVQQRLEKQLRRRARELGFALKPIERPAVPQ